MVAAGLQGGIVALQGDPRRLGAQDAVARFAQALGGEDAPARVEELARLGGFGRLRDLGVPEADLDEVAEAVVLRRGALENPRAVTAEEVAELLRSVW